MLSWQPLLPWFLKLIFDHSFKGAHAGCCLLLLAAAACCCCCLLLLAACCCLLLAAACCCLLLLAAACCCLLLLAAAASCLFLACFLPAACLLLATTVFDMQPFCPNLTCESGVPVWIKKNTAHEILAGVVLRSGVHMGICLGGLGRPEASVKRSGCPLRNTIVLCDMWRSEKDPVADSGKCGADLDIQ